MRRNAGWFVRGKALQKTFLMLTGLGIGFGLAFASIFNTVVAPWIGNGLTVILYIALAVAFSAAVLILGRSSNRWSLDNLWKGVDAEKRVGETIEYAITAENCAVAHSVFEIARVGDIDHIVATPVGIWVIETKYKRVRAKSFPKVLSRIAANTDAVRQWAPAGTPVRGCLVLAYENEIKQQNYLHGKEKITAYIPELLIARDETRSTSQTVAR